MPELLPVAGRRIRISYPGVQILCTNCFGKHHKSKCGSPKIAFKDYVISFARRNPKFPMSVYGRWAELINVVGNPPVNLSTATPRVVDQSQAQLRQISDKRKTNLYEPMELS